MVVVLGFGLWVAAFFDIANIISGVWWGKSEALSRQETLVRVPSYGRQRASMD